MGAPLFDQCSKHSLLLVNLLQDEIRSNLLHVDSVRAKKKTIGPFVIRWQVLYFFLLQNSYF